jgi:tyrosine-protein phosphatase SIW14
MGAMQAILNIVCPRGRSRAVIREVMNMRDRITGPFAMLFAMALLASSTMAQDDLRYRELPNFHQVNATLYRGAQPKADGIHKLVALGIKTIINLRAADERSRAEESEARAAGLRYFNIPMEGLSRPKDEQVERALAIINDAANQPVFVHCKRGADRTGTLIAIYRIMHDGWSSEDALREAKRYGMSWMEFGMKDYVKDYSRDHAGERNGRVKTSSSLHPASGQLAVSQGLT